MPERVSKIAHQYGGRDLSKGDKFEVEPQHVDLLLKLGRIEPEKSVEVEYIDEPSESTSEVTGTLHAKRTTTKRRAA